MFRIKPNLLTGIILLGALLFLPAGSQSKADYKTGEASTIGIIIDASGSMIGIDPVTGDKVRNFEYALEAARMVVSLVSDRDTVAAVRFSEKADTKLAFKPTVMKNAKTRNACIAKIDNLKAKGGTSYYYALQTMRKALESVNAPEGTPVIFLTDGKPGDNPRHAINWEIEKYIKHKWPLHTILLGSAVDEERWAEKMASSTGGAFYNAKEPEELIDAFLAICVDVLGYMAIENDNRTAFEPLPLLPDTDQLVYLTVRAGAQRKPSIVNVQHQKKPFDRSTNPAVYHFPADAGAKALFEAFNVPSPARGVWSTGIEGPTIRRVLLGQFPFKTSLARDRLKTEYLVGELMEVALDVTSDSRTVLSTIKNNSIVELRYVEGSPDNPPKKTFKLETLEESTGRLRYSGSTETVLNEPFSPEFVTLFATFKLEYQGGTWINTKKASFRVKPRGNIIVEPSHLDFGVIALPDGTSEQEVRFKTGLETGMRVKSAGGFAGLTMRPENLQPVRGMPATTKLTLASSPGVTQPGPTTGFFSFDARDKQGNPSKEPLEIKIQAFWIEARVPSMIDLGQHPAAADFSSQSPIHVAPADAEGWKIEITDLIKSASAPIKVKSAPDFAAGKISLSGKIPENAEPGIYNGGLVVSFKDCTETWKCPVTLEVRVPDPTFSKAKPVPALTRTGRQMKAELAFQVGNLENGKIAWELTGFDNPDGSKVFNPKYDVEIKPLGNWSFDAVMPGTCRASVEFYIYDDLPSGEYRGAVQLTLSDSDGRKIGVLSYPFALEVTDGE
ncbi:MAG: VWA domain-containing protein [Planctomycetota bacterium]|nr:MAG: VWA domain-containing protein [Planctomycetota bacterium]